MNCIFISYHLTNIHYYIGLILSSSIFAITGYFLGGFLGRYLNRFYKKVEDLVGRMPISDLIFSFIGIILGIILAAPIIYIGLSIGLSQISFLSMIGLLVSMFISFLVIFITARIVHRRKDSILGLIRRRGRFSNEKIAIGHKKFAVKQKILDTSSIIDGRIYHICKTGFIEGQLIIPNFVIDELHKIADSSDDIKRRRGRTGLDMLNKLTEEEKVEVKIMDTDFSNLEGVDSKLIKLAKNMKAAIITNDYNLNKVAKLQKIKVLNVNNLSNAVKQIILPGEKISVQLIREGKEEDQGIAYLDDGTMIVVENGKKLVGQTVDVEVKGLLQTPAGRMIFTKLLK
jgi:uncharacterized protein YacL